MMKIKDVFSPGRPGSVEIGGCLGQRIDQLIDNSVMAQDVERLLRPFRDKSEDGNCDWRTEYWGKWITGTALACAYKNTPEHPVLNKALDDLIATCDDDGYIGTRKRECRLNGWDVWGRKYVLLGLLAGYDVSGREDVLKAACRHADTLLDECGEGGVNIAAIGYPLWKGLPPSSVLEPMLLLYFRTGEKKYLDFAEHIVQQWSKPNHWSPRGLRLIEDALSGKKPSEIADAPKAYEMMSCYEGLCELYRAGGNRKYLDASIALAQGIFKHEMTVVGSGSGAELWCDSHKKQCADEMLDIETCVTVTWMKFCYQLLRLTGDAQYADALENALYNALLGALMPQGQWWAYMSYLSGERIRSHKQHEDAGTSCCVLSGPRAMLLTPLWAVMTDSAGIVVNLYNRGTAGSVLPSGNDVRIIQETGYPIDNTVKIILQMRESEKFTLSLRIPAWSKETTLAVNGEAIALTASGCYLKLQREWHNADSIEINFDFRGRVLTEPAGKDFVALKRGPLTLALDNRLNSAPTGKSLSLVKDADAYVELRPNPVAAKKHSLMLAVDADFTGQYGSVETLTFCDYASAGNTWDSDSMYSVWFEQPLDLDALRRRIKRENESIRRY